jgi:hypothetical protein
MPLLPGFDIVKPFKFPPQPYEYKVTPLRECPTPDQMQECDTPAKVADYWRRHVPAHPYFSPECECFVVLILSYRCLGGTSQDGRDAGTVRAAGAWAQFQGVCAGLFQKGQGGCSFVRSLRGESRSAAIRLNWSNYSLQQKCSDNSGHEKYAKRCNHAHDGTRITHLKRCSRFAPEKYPLDDGENKAIQKRSHGQ